MARIIDVESSGGLRQGRRNAVHGPRDVRAGRFVATMRASACHKASRDREGRVQRLGLTPRRSGGLTVHHCLLVAPTARWVIHHSRQADGAAEVTVREGTDAVPPGICIMHAGSGRLLFRLSAGSFRGTWSPVSLTVGNSLRQQHESCTISTLETYSHSKDFGECCKYIENEQLRARSRRAMMPFTLLRVLRTIYKFRSQRGAVHIRRPTDNHMELQAGY